MNVRGRLKIIDRRPHVLQSQDSPTVRLLIVVGIALVEARERLESLASPLPSASRARGLLPHLASPGEDPSGAPRQPRGEVSRPGVF